MRPSLLHRAADCDAALAGAGRRLHRFLRRHPPRHQHRPDAAARQSAAAELQAHAGRLSRPRLLDPRVGHARAAAERPAQAGGCDRAGFRAVPLSRLRARARRLDRARQRARRADPDRRGPGAHRRLLPAQRLVGARYPGLGVSAARAVPGQEFRHHGVALGGDAGSAGAVPDRAGAAAGGRSAAARLSDGRTGQADGAFDIDAGGADPHRSHARARIFRRIVSPRATRGISIGRSRR